MSKIQKPTVESNIDTDQDVMARKSEIFDIQVGQDTLKVKWDELEKFKTQRLNELQEVLKAKQAVATDEKE